MHFFHSIISCNANSKLGQSIRGALLAVVVLALSLLVFLYRLTDDVGIVWDENYHLCSANKYLSGVMFMEPHPPLGKLLIAASEAIAGVNDNVDNYGLLKSDYVPQAPAGYSLWPARLPSLLAAALGFCCLFYILYINTSNLLVSFVFSFCYLFDNAMVAHCRAAMLEGPQILFVLLALAFFYHAVVRDSGHKMRYYFLIGTCSGLATATKVTGGLTLLLLPLLWLHQNKFGFHSPAISWISLIRSFALRAAVFLCSATAIVLMTFYLHCGLGSRIVHNRAYGASAEYVKIIESGEVWNPTSFPVMLRDNLIYMYEYNGNVPALNLEDPADNGSHPLFWPFGAKAISYRWDRQGAFSRHIYMVPNPVSWCIGGVGLFFGVMFSVMYFLTNVGAPNLRVVFPIAYAVVLWAIYMLAMLAIPRVMYLYHYLIPLTFSWILAGLSFKAVLNQDLKDGSVMVRVGLYLLLVSVVAMFLFFAPFTYHLPVDEIQFSARDIFSLWRLRNGS